MPNETPIVETDVPERPSTKPWYRKRWGVTFWDESNGYDGSLDNLKSAVVFLVDSETMAKRVWARLKAEHEHDVAGWFRFGPTESSEQTAALEGVVKWYLTGARGNSLRRSYARQCERWLKELISAAASRVAPGTRKAEILISLLQNEPLPPADPFLSKKKTLPAAYRKMKDASSYSDVFQQLRDDLLIESRQQGSKGGYRLTPAGRARAKELASPPQ